MTQEQRDMIPAIEAEIEARTAADAEIYYLDDEDRQDIRDEIYQDHGFDRDPFYEEPEDEEEDEDEDEDEYSWPMVYDHGYWRPRDWMSVKLEEVGMCERDFF